MYIFPSSILKQKSALVQLGLGLVVRGKFGCRNATNIARELPYGHEFKLDSTAKNTLQSRWLEYFRLNSKYSHMTLPRSPTSARSVMQYDKPLKEHLMELPALNNSKLAGFIQDLQHKNVNPSVYEMEFAELLSFLDEECSYRIKMMSRRDVLTMLDAWMHWMPHKITQLKFYYCFIEQMKKWLTDPHLPVEDFIKLVFYTGLEKKSFNENDIMQVVTNFIEENIDVQSLSIEELCILANAFFKNGAKITSSKLFARINDVIIKHFDVMLEEPAFFTTLVKAIRHAQNYDYEVLDAVSNRMLSNKRATHHLGFTAKSHILAWYGTSLYGRLDIFSFLVESSQKDLTTSKQFYKTKASDHFTIYHRSRDLGRFMWSLSRLNCLPTSELQCIKSAIVPELLNRFKRGDFIKKPDEIITCLLSMWVLGFKAETLLAKVVSSKNVVSHLRGESQYSRLALLLTCASIESPGVLANDQLSLKDSLSTMRKPNWRKYMSSRPQFEKIYSIVYSLSEVLKASRVSCNYVIPHLHIAGIKLEMKACPVYVEVLDPTVCLYKSGKPHGLMQLKLRLMEALHYQIVVIENHEIEKRIDDLSSLYQYIEEKIVSASKRS